ncbi:MAG: sodium:solute symporter family transporter [Planctomycetota bacterium]
MWVGRLCVIIISFIALVMALDRDNTILGIVSYAWGGFGAAFGPLILFALFSRKTSWQSALAGMVTGTVVLVLWKQIGLGEKMYEIVPGFAANCLTILLVNLLIGQKDESVLKEFDAVVNEIKK